MEKINIKSQLQGLINQAPATPVQKVQQIKKQSAYHLNLWINNTLENQLKQHALTNQTSIKEICIKALTEYLEHSERVDIQKTAVTG